MLRKSVTLILISCCLTLASCKTVTLVQPYDERLISGTEDFYKAAARVVEQGRANSPQKRPDSVDSQLPGHLAQFEGHYASLMVDANALILRAFTNSSKVDSIGQKLQLEVEGFVNETFPSNCQGGMAMLDGEFASLTVRNFLDLKCLVTHWQTQHANAPCHNAPVGAELCQVLTRGDWQRRLRSLTAIIVAIQKAETHKISQTQL